VLVLLPELGLELGLELELAPVDVELPPEMKLVDDALAVVVPVPELVDTVPGLELAVDAEDDDDDEEEDPEELDEEDDTAAGEPLTM